MSIFSKLGLNSKFEPVCQDKPAYDHQIEGLRGFAAISVAFHHVFSFQNHLDPTYQPNLYFNYLQAGHSAVLIFFVLSGYVIGLTNSSAFSIQKTGRYLFRRGLRLIPIYFIAVCLGILIRADESLVTTIGNFIFAQNLDKYFSWSLPPISGNQALWSLNYEVLYYLLFILIWWLRPGIVMLFFSALLISLVGWVNPLFPQFISGYASGWIFWLGGLWLAWKTTSSKKETISFPLISYILLFYATHHLATGKIILSALKLENPVASFVNLSDLAILPICLLILAEVTRKRFSWLIWLQLFCFLVPTSILLFLFLKGRLFENHWWVVSAIFTVASIALIRFKSSKNILKFLAPVGSISYAFYLLHTPLLFLIHDYFPWQGTVWSFLCRFIFWFAITASLSSLLELVVQPAIKRWAYLKS